MPIVYRYDPFNNRLTTRCEGALHLSDAIEHFGDLRRDARMRPHCDVLLDLCFVEGAATAQEVDAIAVMIEKVNEIVPFGRCAVVALEDLEYGLGRMFQGFTWPLFTGIKVFRRNAEAIAWLDAPS